MAKNMKIVRSDGKTYESLDEVFQEIIGKLADDTPEDMGCDGDCDNYPEQGNDYLDMAQEAYAIYTAFQQAGFSPEQAFELLLAGMVD